MKNCVLQFFKFLCDKHNCLWYYKSDISENGFCRNESIFKFCLQYTSSNGLKGSFTDTERYEYKWAGNSNVNAVWTSEVGEQFEHMYRLFFFCFQALMRYLMQ